MLIVLKLIFVSSYLTSYKQQRDQTTLLIVIAHYWKCCLEPAKHKIKYYITPKNAQYPCFHCISIKYILVIIYCSPVLLHYTEIYSEKENNRKSTVNNNI